MARLPVHPLGGLRLRALNARKTLTHTPRACTQGRVAARTVAVEMRMRQLLRQGEGRVWEWEWEGG